MISQIEKILRDTPDVATTARRTGLQLGLAAVTEANQGDISVKLKPMASFWTRLFGTASKNERTRPGDEVIADVRAKINEIAPALDVEFPQLLQDMIGDLTSAPQPVVIKLFSEDPELLRHWAPLEASTIEKIPGVVDVENGIENTTSGTAVVFNVDPVVAARAGFTPQEVELDASAMLQGEPATTPIVQNARSYTIRVQFPPSARQTLESMQKTVIVSGTGKTATIGSLATLTEIPGQTEIIRDNLQRCVNVTARLEGINLGAGMAAVQRSVAESNLPPGIRVEYGGQYAEQQKSFRDLVFRARPCHCPGLYGAALRIRRVQCACCRTVVGAPFDLRSFSCSPDHRDHLQPVVVYGPDYGDWHCRQERDFAAGCRPEVPG